MPGGFETGCGSSMRCRCGGACLLENRTFERFASLERFACMGCGGERVVHRRKRAPIAWDLRESVGREELEHRQLELAVSGGANEAVCAADQAREEVEGGAMARQLGSSSYNAEAGEQLARALRQSGGLRGACEKLGWSYGSTLKALGAGRKSDPSTDQGAFAALIDDVLADLKAAKAKRASMVAEASAPAPGAGDRARVLRLPRSGPPAPSVTSRMPGAPALAPTNGTHPEPANRIRDRVRAAPASLLAARASAGSGRGGDSGHALDAIGIALDALVRFAPHVRLDPAEVRDWIEDVTVEVLLEENESTRGRVAAESHA